MKTYKFFQLLCLLLLINACTKELPFPDADDNPLLVVNSLFNPDTIFQLHLSESCHIQKIDCTLKNIEDAQVNLKDANGTLLTSLIYEGNGIYSPSNFSIDNNTTYQLEINHSTLGQKPLTAQSKVPKDFTCNFIDKEETVVNGAVVWAFEVEIVDNPDEENYYILEGYFDILDGEHDEGALNEVNGYIEPHFGHFSNDINAENNSLTSGFDYITYPLRNVYLPDKNFNGQTYRTQFGVKDWDLLFGGFEEVNAHVFVKSVSKEMYEYLKSLELNALSQGNIFSEPVQVYSNLNNDIGIFAGYTQKTFIIDLPKSEFGFPSDVDVENDNCTGPCTIKFSTNGGSSLNYHWDFGDGNTSTEPNPEHTYTSSGVYNVEMEASTSSSGSGDSSGFNFQVTVN